jgi:hypothetical protein
MELSSTNCGGAEDLSDALASILGSKYTGPLLPRLAEILNEDVDQNGVIWGAWVGEQNNPDWPQAVPQLFLTLNAPRGHPGNCIVVTDEKTFVAPGGNTVWRFRTGIKPLVAFAPDSKESYTLNPAI